MFSVVIPLYNKELSVRNTINSVLNQTFKEFEVIIVNDGSTDNSLEIVQQFKDDRIRIIDKPNGGVSSARNRGIKEANYEWIAFLDADDLWMDEHLETFYRNISRFTGYIAFCNSYIRTSLAEKYVYKYNPENIIVDSYFEYALKSFFMWTSCVCVHKKVFDDKIQFNTKLSRGEDLEVWMNIGKEHPIVWSQNITAKYNMVSENKLTKSKVPIENCYENYLNFKDTAPLERKYLKLLASRKITSLLRQMNIKDAARLLLKYNFNLL